MYLESSHSGAMFNNGTLPHNINGMYIKFFPVDFSTNVFMEQYFENSDK